MTRNYLHFSEHACTRSQETINTQICVQVYQTQQQIPVFVLLHVQLQMQIFTSAYSVLVVKSRAARARVSTKGILAVAATSTGTSLAFVYICNAIGQSKLL